MILTLIFIGMIILGIVIIKIDNSTCLDSALDIAENIFILFGSIFLITAICVIIITNITANNTIQRNKINYDGLCKRYEIIKSDYEDVSKSDVIADITAWNMKVYNTKYWSENPWTNWFNPKKIADNLNYIPLEAESEDKE